ncbi:hypothetical protein VN1172_06160 [Helicobacter pylori]|uniref:hypothetical protein n=1 Tax=Helicobacter pylori TaxID=210 RepID=UPI001036FDCB|nr:hypothetical protein [Helicobacter pylori]GHS58138.1 hypothetical protein VN1172_06160 [Helicobacter pylori]
MRNINFIKNFKNIKNKKKRLAFKKGNNERLLNNRGYRDFIAKIKSKNQNDDEILENLELSYIKI